MKHFNFFVLQKFLNMGVNQSKGSVDITSTPNKGPAPEVNGKKADEKIIDEKTKVRFLFYFYTGCPNKFCIEFFEKFVKLKGVLRCLARMSTNFHEFFPRFDI